MKTFRIVSAEQSNNQSLSQDSDIPHLPNELQREIFERAAALNGVSAFVLTQVASYVNAWVHPILYSRVVIRSSHAASCFLKNTRSKPIHYFDNLVKSLTLTENVGITYLKPILAELRHIISFTLFGMAYTQEMFNILNLIRSPYLRRITLVYRHNSERFRTTYRVHEIPPKILTTLTHLTIVTDHPDMFNSSWDNLSVAVSITAGTHVSTNLPSLPGMFQHLTHFAASFCRHSDVCNIGMVAHNLRYFVILLPVSLIYTTRNGLLNYARIQKGFHVVILKDVGDTACWLVEDSFGPSQFWRKVERLVEDGYVSDEGHLKDIQGKDGHMMVTPGSI